MSPPRIAIFGAGAIGLYLAARLGLAGLTPTLVTRPGRALAEPLQLIEGDSPPQPFSVQQAPADQPSPHDVLIVATKAHQLADAWPTLHRWLAADGQLVLAQNGLPWWYFADAHGQLARPLRAADPDGRLGRGIDLNRVIACVVHKSVERPAANVVCAFAVAGDRLILGRPSGQIDPALTALVETLSATGIASEAHADIRAAIWDKLLGNAVLNPLSALTGLELAALLANPTHRQRILDGMGEARQVAQAYGVPSGRTAAERLARTEQVAASGAFRTSMLQDVAAGKSLELEPIVGTVRELAASASIATPTLDQLYAEVRQQFCQSFRSPS